MVPTKEKLKRISPAKRGKNNGKKETWSTAQEVPLKKLDREKLQHAHPVQGKGRRNPRSQKTRKNYAQERGTPFHLHQPVSTKEKKEKTEGTATWNTGRRNQKKKRSLYCQGRKGATHEKSINLSLLWGGWLGSKWTEKGSSWKASEDKVKRVKMNRGSFVGSSGKGL